MEGDILKVGMREGIPKNYKAKNFTQTGMPTTAL